ncbi:hypothetical protein B0F90DRAFT_1807876 [Multifurca ochricompacta]|uniref:Uncharacterized protein n=1 Tax=Multifurca ochricompacta TaxID=376703 RepID=A0AAD4MBS7_9AGAM|nr:hypothetical protein B0F90DRAFT_1807876 [Multifurca ochricompacta]
MDEDLGSSVWATPASGIMALSSPDYSTFPQASSAINQLDDFGGFGAQGGATDPGDDDDEFGDFGEFGQAEETTKVIRDSSSFSEPVPVADSSPWDWEPLDFRHSRPSRRTLDTQVEEILGLLWNHDDLSEALTDEDVREVGGLAQILVTPDSSRAFYQSLFQRSPPSAHPPNWIRSRIRQQHLIALGIPVNLDEVLPHASNKPLPALHITTRPPANGHKSLHNSRAGTPLADMPVSGTFRKGAAAQLGLGPKPRLDEQRIGELLALTPDQLSLLPLGSLEAQLSDLRAQTQNTSALLTYVLQTRDALQQDSETYNKLIAELVGEAQKMKTVGGRTPSRRGSGMV